MQQSSVEECLQFCVQINLIKNLLQGRISTAPRRQVNKIEKSSSSKTNNKKKFQGVKKIKDNTINNKNVSTFNIIDSLFNNQSNKYKSNDNQIYVYKPLQISFKRSDQVAEGLMKNISKNQDYFRPYDYQRQDINMQHSQNYNRQEYFSQNFHNKSQTIFRQNPWNYEMTNLINHRISGINYESPSMIPVSRSQSPLNKSVFFTNEISRIEKSRVPQKSPRTVKRQRQFYQAKASIIKRSQNQQVHQMKPSLSSNNYSSDIMNLLEQEIKRQIQNQQEKAKIIERQNQKQKIIEKVKFKERQNDNFRSPTQWNNQESQRIKVPQPISYLDDGLSDSISRISQSKTLQKPINIDMQKFYK